MFKRLAQNQSAAKSFRRGFGLKVAFVLTALVLSMVMGLACGSDDSTDSAKAPQTNGATLPADVAATIESNLTLASFHLESGNLDEALPLLQEVVDLREEFLGLEHEDTATSHYDLGLLHQRMGNHDLALDHLQLALNIRESVLGHEHQDTAASFARLAGAYRVTGDNEGALPNAVSALGIREAVLGIDHPDTAKSVATLADLHYRLGNSSQALPLFQRVLARQEADSGVGHPDAAPTVEILADLFFNIGEYEAALPYFQRTLAFRETELGVGHLDTALWRSNLARLHERLRNFGEAATYYQLAVESTQLALGPQHVDVAARLNDLAELHVRQEAFEQALPHYQSSLKILSDSVGSGHLDTVVSLRGLGESYRGLGDYDLALHHLKNALMIREDALGDDHPEVATSLGELAEVYRIMGDYTEALPLSRRALAIWEAQGPGAEDSLATSLNNLGVLHQDLGDYQQAQQLLQRALDIRDTPQAIEQAGAAIPLATSLNNLAVLYKHTGNFAKSLPLLRRALKIVEDQRGAGHRDTAVFLNNLADFHFSINDFGQALPLYQQALKIADGDRGIGHPKTAPFLNNLANLYFAMENYNEAAPLFVRALDISGINLLERATYQSNLAMLHRNNGNDEMALDLYKDALDLRIKSLGSKHAAVATASNNLATLYSTMGEYDLALALFDDALEIRKATLGVDHPDTAISFNNLGIWHESVGNYGQALDFFLEALAIEDRVINNLFSVVSEEQKLMFSQANQGSYQAALSLINRQFPDDQAKLRAGLQLVLGRKGMVLNSQSRAQAFIASNLQGTNRESWEELIALRGNLANLLIRGPGDKDPAGYGRLIEEINAAIDDKEQLLAEHSSEMAQQFNQRQVTVKMLADRLPHDAMLVEYVRIRDWSDATSGWTDDFTYLAFSLTRNNRVAMVDLGNADQIDSKIANAIITVENPAYARDLRTYARESDTVLSELYAELLEPFEVDLKSHQRLIVSPDGEINKVPFAALRTSESRYLVETHTVSYVASGRDLLREAQEKTPDLNLFLVADAAFDERDVLQSLEGRERGLGVTVDFGPTIFGGKFPPLPGTAREAEVIPPLVRGSKLVLKGINATEESVLSIKSVKVLHLATHGFFIEDSVLPLPNLVTASSLLGEGRERGVGGVENLRPLSTGNRPSSVSLSAMVRSGLAFAGANHAASASSGNDGILTALEVTGMDLRGTELVVLSACETAVGEVRVGEGIFGLRRAFVLAGAENLVMSLWLVNDALTVTQMERFYEGYGQGEPIPEALRQAQLESIATLRGLFQAEIGESIAPVRIWAPFMVQQTGL